MNSKNIDQNRLKVIQSHIESSLLPQSNPFTRNPTTSSLDHPLIDYSDNFKKEQNITMSGSVFGDVPMAPPDPILGMTVAYKNDPSPKKVNLGVGAYRTDEGKPFVLRVVREAEKYILDQDMNKEYIPQDGLALFKEQTVRFVLGSDSEVVKQKKVATIQSISGTGALRLGFDFIAQFLGKDTLVYLPNPTWGNHMKVINSAGLNYKMYTYYNEKTRGLNLEGLLSDLNNAPSGSVVLLHTCAHNPTGVDPTNEEWKKIADLVVSKKLIPFFDTAYQGFASGDLVKDAYSIRYFASRGIELFISQSYAKNFGLYGERIGALNVVCNTQDQAERISSQVKIIVRAMYSSPPLQGARIVGIGLSKPELFKLWEEDLKIMANRIAKMRQALYDALIKRKTPGTWNHILDQIGMFTFTGLTKEQVDQMINKYHIYMLTNGRISVAGLNSGNVEYVADCIHKVVTEA